MSETATAHTIGIMLGAAGSPAELNDHKGRKWLIGHPTQKAKERLEKLATAKASANLRAMRDTLPEDEYEEHFERLSDKIATGDFKTWRSGWHKIVLAADGSGTALFVLALLKEHHPDATEEDVVDLAVNCPEEIKLAMAQVLPPFMALIVEGLPIKEKQKALAIEKLKGATEEIVASLSRSTSAPATAST